MVVATLTVDATIGTQGFIHDRCNIFPGLSDTKANNVFGSPRKNDVEAQVEFTLKVMEGSAVVVVSVTKDSLLVYVPKIFGILAGRCGSVVVRERA